jgi:hypothetical protein
MRSFSGKDFLYLKDFYILATFFGVFFELFCGGGDGVE